VIGVLPNGADTAAATALAAAAAVLLVVLVVVAVRRRRDRRDALFLRRLADAEGTGDAMRRALRQAATVTEASSALISAGDHSGEQATGTLGMTPAEAEAHRFGHGRRVRSVLFEVAVGGGHASVKLGHEDVGDEELERVSTDPTVRSMFIRYDVAGTGRPDEPDPIAGGLAVPIRSHGVPVGVLSVFTRSAGRRFTATEQRALEKVAARVAPFVEARVQAFADELTSLNNLRFFRQVLANEVAAAQRYDRRLGLLAFGLDGLRDINDTPGLGHAAGDLMLQAVAKVARRVVRRSDIACRTGGDEFVVILPESGLDGADLLYERLRREVAALRVEYAGQVLVPKGVSAGAVELRRQDDADSLFDRADAALHRAKAWGKGRVAWGAGDRSAPPPEAGYAAGTAATACAGCTHFRPGQQGVGYCEHWHAPVESMAACRSFGPRAAS
jgi:diguanylate cyclase (GGDEF)-like protein